MRPELVASFDFVSFVIDTDVTPEGTIKPGIRRRESKVSASG